MINKMKRYKTKFNEAFLASEEEGTILNSFNDEDEYDTKSSVQELSESHIEEMQDYLAVSLDESECAEMLVDIIQKIIPPKFNSHETILKIKQML
jgi:hypothetical protein